MKIHKVMFNNEAEKVTAPFQSTVYRSYVFLWFPELVLSRYEELGLLSSKERSEQYRRTLRQALHVWLDQEHSSICLNLPTNALV